MELKKKKRGKRWYKKERKKTAPNPSLDHAQNTYFSTIFYTKKYYQAKGGIKADKMRKAKKSTCQQYADRCCTCY